MAVTTFQTGRGYTTLCYVDIPAVSEFEAAGSRMSNWIPDIIANVNRFASDVSIDRDGTSAAVVTPHWIADDTFAFVLRFTSRGELSSYTLGSQILASVNYRVANNPSVRPANAHVPWYSSLWGYFGDNSHYVIAEWRDGREFRGFETGGAASGVSRVTDAINPWSQPLQSTDASRNGATTTQDYLANVAGFSTLRTVLYVAIGVGAVVGGSALIALVANAVRRAKNSVTK